jgi:hypothetical protein
MKGICAAVFLNLTLHAWSKFSQDIRRPEAGVLYAAPAQVLMAEEGSDMVVLPSGQCVQNAFVEEIARELVPALDQVAVIHTARRDFLVAMVTLRLSEDLAGRLLGDDALALARKHGSTANTLITARSCCIFRRGLEAAFANVNLALAAAGLPDAQIQRCHILLNGFCKEDNTLRASGTLNRSQIARKHANLMHTLLAPVSAGDTVPTGTVIIATDKNAVRKGPKKYNVMTHARWLERKAGDQVRSCRVGRQRPAAIAHCSCSALSR